MRRLLATLVLVGAAACGGSGGGSAAGTTGTTTAPATTSTATTASPPTTTTAPTTTTTAPPGPGSGCPATMPAPAAPDPARPTYDVTATIDVPAGAVEGTATIGFTPDLLTDVVVLRLWANAPRLAAAGTVAAVGAVTVDGAPAAVAQPENTLVEVRPGRMIAPGERITLTVPFRVQVGAAETDDRVSRAADGLRLGSVFPLLAWEPGVGWATEPPTTAFAETVTSPTADWDVRLEVTEGFKVLASGRADGHGNWRVTAARDFALSIGYFDLVASIESLPQPVEVLVGVDATLAATESAAAYHQRAVEALRDFSTRFGPYPWDTFTLAITAGLGGGIEFPTHVMQGPGTVGRTTPHEVGHQWFYGLVGNDQGRDPWLDEGLASYAEFRFEGTVEEHLAYDIPAAGRGRVGEPMTFWESNQRAYYRSVYVQGANALAALGPLDLVDCALRLYAAANAHGIARPEDLVAAAEVVFADAAATLGRFGIG